MDFFKNILATLIPTKVEEESGNWLVKLKGMDDVSAIEFCTKQLTDDFHKDLFKSEPSLDALFKIDEKAHIIVERITAHYVNIEHINNELEERIENTVFFYHRQLFLIYLNLIDHFAPLKHHHLAKMLARAMFSATEMIKWRYYCYESAPANVWIQISHLYQIAQEQLLLNDSMQTYPDQLATKLASNYIKVCMLGTLESLSLKSQQIELVSHILSAWTEKISIEHTYDEEKHQFFIDTTSDVSAKRIRNFKPADSYLYWCLDDVNINIELCLSLIEFNIAPKQQTISAVIKHPYALATLEILRSEWSRLDYKRQRRSEERVKTIKSATTAYGFEDVCNQLKQYEHSLKPTPTEGSLDERLAFSHKAKAHGEPNVIYMDFSAGYSNIIDESNKGLGLHISKHANEVSLGMLVCVTVKEDKNITKIGAIRSIRPIAGGELHIGIEIFSKSAVRVQTKNMSLIAVQPDTNTNSSATLNLSNVASNFTCLYLPQETGFSIQETLIFPKSQYNKNECYRVNIFGNEHIVKLLDTLEQREDWIRVSYTQE